MLIRIFISTSFILFSSHSLFAATLQEAFQSALVKNEVTAIQAERVKQLQEQVKQVRGGVFPQLSAKATYFQQPELADPIAQEFFPARQTTASLSANQILFRGLREFAAIRQAKNLMSAQEETRNQALVQLYQDVSSTYLNVLTLEQDLKNLVNQGKLYEDRVAELKIRVRKGESNSADLLTAQASEAAIKAEAEIVRGNLKMARELFGFVTGLKVDEELSDPQLIQKTKVASLDYYLKRIEERYDVRVARENYLASEEEVRFAKGAHWPTLDATGNYYFKRPEGFSEDLKWDFQLTLTLPIFEGGTTQAAVREAASKRMEADLALARLRRQADQEINAYYENYQQRLKQLAALEKATELSERNYQLLQKDYRRGLARNIDVQVALTDFRVATRAWDQARFAAQLDLVKLQVAAAEIVAPVMKEE